MATIILIPRANDRRITYSLSSGGTAITQALFTIKEIGDIAQNDTDALISTNATVNHVGDTLNGYIDLTHDNTDIDEGPYKFDFKLKSSTGTLVNTTSGFIVISDRVTVRES